MKLKAETPCAMINEGGRLGRVCHRHDEITGAAGAVEGRWVSPLLMQT